jgi:hypothetical protein
MYLVKDTVGVKRYPSRLGRAGAVRKRKGEIKEVNGHKFAVQQFYQIMRCALCSDLFSGAGAQCEGKLGGIGWELDLLKERVRGLKSILKSHHSCCSPIVYRLQVYLPSQMF